MIAIDWVAIVALQFRSSPNLSKLTFVFISRQSTPTSVLTPIIKRNVKFSINGRLLLYIQFLRYLAKVLQKVWQEIPNEIITFFQLF